MIWISFYMRILKVITQKLQLYSSELLFLDANIFNILKMYAFESIKCYKNLIQRLWQRVQKSGNVFLNLLRKNYK